MKEKPQKVYQTEEEIKGTERTMTDGREKKINEYGEKNRFAAMDYFEKYGFEDGNNPVIAKKAEELRPRFLEILNEEFQKRGLPYRARALNYGSAHNKIRACVEWEEAGEKFEWDDCYWDQHLLEPRAYPGKLVTSTLKKPSEYNEEYERQKHPEVKQFYAWSVPQGIREAISVAEETLRNEVGAGR